MAISQRLVDIDIGLRMSIIKYKNSMKRDIIRAIIKGPNYANGGYCMELVDVLKALADETRLRILNVLCQESLCVCDLEDVLKLSQSNASRHLTKLRHCRLIVAEKQAQWVYYRINETLLAEQPSVRAILEQELGKGAKYQQDLSKLRQYRNQGGGCGCTEKSP